MGRGTAGLLAATTLLVAGCDSEEALDLPGLPGGEEDEPDLDRVRTALRDEQAVLDQITRARRRHRSLRRSLAATAEVHRAHAQLLGRAVEGNEGDEGDEGDGSTPPAGSGTRVPRDPAVALAQLVRSERSLAQRHVETSMRARSGDLARVLAAMSAAAAQQEVTLGALVVQRNAAQGAGG